MKATVKVDSRVFNEYTRSISRMLGVSVERAMVPEAASVLKVASQKAKPAAKGKIRADTRQRVFKRIRSQREVITTNIRKDRGRVWYGWLRYGKWRWKIAGEFDFRSTKLYISSELSEDLEARVMPIWNQGKVEFAQEVAKGLASRGLELKSWIEMIQALGFAYNNAAPKTIRAPGDAFIARPRNRGPIRNGYAQIQRGKNVVIESWNTSPIAIKRGGQRRINYAIARRQKHFVQNVKHGVFNDMTAVGQRYPGIVSRLRG